MEKSLTSTILRYLDLKVYSSAIFLAERLVCERSSDEHVGLLAEAYYRGGEGIRAISLLQDHQLNNNPILLSSKNRYLLALCCYEAGRFSEAEQALIQSKEIPNGAAGLHLLGNICKRNGRISQAIEYYKESLRQDPYLWSSFEELCDLGCEIPPTTLFPCTKEQIVSNSPEEISPFTRAKVKKAMSRTFTEKDDFDATKRLSFSDAAPTPPIQFMNTNASDELLKLLQALGSGYQSLSLFRSSEALEIFYSLPTHHLNSTWVQHQIARGYFELAQYSEVAAAIFQRIREIEPERMHGMSLYSTTLWHLKREVELCFLAQQVTDTNKRSSEAWCAAGNCFSLQKEHDTALIFFQRAIQVDPTFTYAYTLAGHEYVFNEDFEKAIGCFRQAIRLNPRHYNAWYGIGMIYSRQEKYELAQYHFQKALEINPHSSLLHCFMGVVMHALKKDQKAIESLHHALRIQPHNLTARFHMANILVTQERLEEALSELRQVQTYAPKEYTVHYMMGKICKRLGRRDEALRYFNNALYFNPKELNEIKTAIDTLHEEDQGNGL